MQTAIFNRDLFVQKICLVEINLHETLNFIDKYKLSSHKEATTLKKKGMHLEPWLLNTSPITWKLAKKTQKLATTDENLLNRKLKFNLNMDIKTIFLVDKLSDSSPHCRLHNFIVKYLITSLRLRPISKWAPWVQPGEWFPTGCDT